MKFDQTNLRLLELLQRDARISNMNLAEQVALSESGCLGRVRKLHSDGVIAGYRTELNLNKVRHVHFIVSVALKSQDSAMTRRFKTAINAIAQVVSCFKVSGEFDYILHWFGRDAQEFNRVTEELIARDLGIERMISQLVIEDTKPFAGYPVALLFGDD